MRQAARGSGWTGRAIAERLARDGHAVVINGRHPASVGQTVAQLRAAGLKAFAAAGDVTRADDVRDVVQAALDATGRLDVLVNNAGGVNDIDASPRLEELSEAAWHAVLDRNLTGALLCCQAAAPRMKERGWGRIINIASESARVPIVPPRGGYAYAAAKAGLVGLSRVLAAELAPFGITVNVVAPGFTRSGPRMEERFAAMAEEQRRERVRPIKLGRWAELREIASAVSFLVSEDASYCVGAALDVNGGSFMP